MSDTLAAPATRAVEIRHSRFLAYATALVSPADMPGLLAQVGDHNATHNCWAYRIGGQYRSSDDGEPAGTAGRPILAAIDGQGFDQVAVVVTRWYGGTKLGAGGLVRAYGGTAAGCLRAAVRKPLVALGEMDLFAAFEDIGAVHLAMAAQSASRLQEAFTSHGVRLRVTLPADQLDAFKARLRDVTRDRIRFTAAD